MIPLTPKEIVIRVARFFFGEKRTHDYLIRRGIELRKLKNGYTDNSEKKDKTASTNAPKTNRQQLIFMADGKWMHGGLTDRLRGMASAYNFAVEHHLDFKIYHVSPIKLQDILVPNKVNWLISEAEIARETSIAKPVLLYREDFDNDSALERQLDTTHTQFHLYSCIDTLGEKFPERFRELFKPSPLLSQELEHYGSLLGTGYKSYSFRFQNKLGDFREFTFKEISTAEKKELLDAAINALKKEACNTDKILVTADSPTFLAEASKIRNVVVVKGTSVHIDFNSSSKTTDYLKAFTEFFLISKASKAELYQNKKFRTYPSNFPKYAALLGNVPYKIVVD